MYVRMHKGDARRRRLSARARPSHCERRKRSQGEAGGSEGVASSHPSASPSNALGCICRGLSRAYLGAPETLSGGFRRKELGLSAADERDDVRRRGHRPGRTRGGGTSSTVNSVIGDRRPPTWISNGDATTVAAACCIARGARAVESKCTRAIRRRLISPSPLRFK